MRDSTLPAIIAVVALTALSALTPAAAAQEAGDGERGLTVEPVRVTNGRIGLASTLLIPPGAGPHATVVLISGSRDGVFSPGDSLPRRIAEQGIAVLVLGKRGVGASTGDWRRESFAQRAADVRRAIDFVEQRPDVDRSRIGLVGHSQGGWIAQIVAAEDSRVTFAVLLAAPAMSVKEQIITDERIHSERRGNRPADVERETRRLRRQLNVLSAVAPACRAVRASYLCHIIRFDPAPYLERIHVPVLALFGELDPMVPPDPNARLLTAVLSRAGNSDITVHVVPQANHLFWRASTGLRDEYASLDSRYVDGFLDLIGEWIADRTRRTEAGKP